MDSKVHFQVPQENEDMLGPSCHLGLDDSSDLRMTDLAGSGGGDDVRAHVRQGAFYHEGGCS